MHLDSIHTNMVKGSWLKPEAGRVLFREFAETWMSQRHDLAPRTRDQYKSLLRCHLNPTFGSTPISKIASSEVRAWIANLAPSKPGAAPSAYRLLRAILNTAVEDEVIPRNPCRVKGAGSDRAVERVPPTVGEAEALMMAMPEHLRAAVMIACAVPIRRNEVLGLQRRDINIERWTLRVERQLDECPGQELTYRPTKNGESSTVHIPEDVVLVLADHMERYVAAHPTSPLFVGRTGVAVRPGTFWHAWDKARRQTGLTAYHFHDMRHFAATMLAASGASVAEIKQRGRWRSNAMPLRYQHATQDRDAILARAIAPFVPLPTVGEEKIAPRSRPSALQTRPFDPNEAVEQEESSGGETRTLNLAGSRDSRLVPGLTRIVPVKGLFGPTTSNRSRPQFSDRSRADRARRLINPKYFALCDPHLKGRSRNHKP
jgi:integrase